MDEPHSALTRRLIADGLRVPEPRRSFSDVTPELRAAVNAYDEARRAVSSRTGEPPMSDANKAHIAPMIMAAVRAYLQATKQDRAA